MNFSGRVERWSLNEKPNVVYTASRNSRHPFISSVIYIINYTYKMSWYTSVMRPAPRYRKCEHHLVETGVLWSTQSRHQIFHFGAVLQSLQVVVAVHAMIAVDDQTSNYITVHAYSKPVMNITYQWPGQFIGFNANFSFSTSNWNMLSWNNTQWQNQ